MSGRVRGDRCASDDEFTPDHKRGGTNNGNPPWIGWSMGAPRMLGPDHHCTPNGAGRR